MKRDAPFEPIDGDFDKFIQELHKNSAHNAAIHKSLAEQKLNGSNIDLESPQQSFNKIRQQHKETMNTIVNSVREHSDQMSQASCAHEVFDNRPSFNQNDINLQNKTRHQAKRGTINPQTINNINNIKTNNPKSDNKKVVPNPIFAIFGIFCLFIFVMSGSPAEGMIFMAAMIFMQIVSIVIANKKRNKNK